jgi:hypothetical protein
MAMPQDATGPIPAGIWRLNTTRSRLLSPKTLTLWIIHNSNEELKWVAVQTDARQRTSVHSWEGHYGGEPEVVAARVSRRVSRVQPQRGFVPRGVSGNRSVHRVLPAQWEWATNDLRREVSTADGPLTYCEDFDWFSESPHSLAVPVPESQ